jgi:RHH-type transcriptional regulator, proline utilization regulon repressor / proline dehydrogenase / delta 1-pyrroline-5-carboxylate dehydrogenase
MKKLTAIRKSIRNLHIADEASVTKSLMTNSQITQTMRDAFADNAVELVEGIRADDHPGLMEVFLAEYGLSTDEGVALMCLAEALLRVPDAATIDELIEDKIAPSSWGAHLGKSASSLVNASTWALMLTGKILEDDKSENISGLLHGAVKRLGEPVIRTAVKQAMKEMGNQFVLGETIQDAVKRGMEQQKRGYTYSYDMLGEAALTANDADGFFHAYRDAIEALAVNATSTEIRENPGISVKLSALHPRYEVGQKKRVMAELVEQTLALAVQAKEARMGFNIDAEEADRLDLSLDVIEAVLSDTRLANWDGFGVVVQAYGKRASAVVDWLYALATNLDRNIMVRLVKGAYWDTEIKRAQVEGLPNFPVFTNKSATDVSYICCARKLLSMTDRIYPQFATHNAHSVAAIIRLASDSSCFEFQRLHGMGEALHRQVMEKNGTRCRIYAPVGAHRDLLAYLVRRLLENGANSSFVNQIVDKSVSAREIAADPFQVVEQGRENIMSPVKMAAGLYAPERKNSRGWDLHNQDDIDEIEKARAPYIDTEWNAEPLLAEAFIGEAPRDVFNPAKSDELVGKVIYATTEDVSLAITRASDWSHAKLEERAKVLNRAADLYEENFGELFAALTREAGKTPMDAIGELREAVDFLRYYATQIEHLKGRPARGIVSCISPWNFPLAIFTGQISAALAAGNGVLAKPADPAPIIATIAVKLMHRAGVPKTVLQLLPGRGAVVGAAMVSDPRISAMCFTGSNMIAQTINKSMAANLDPGAPLIAETGGLNAMIVDSTALPEQAVKDIVASSFQSAGQRCSALRLLYLQEDIAPAFMEMLFGAMDELTIGDPWMFSTDVGPVITDQASKGITDHIELAKQEGRVLKQLDVPENGTFVAPTVIEVSGMEQMTKEIFGPVLHIATFTADEIDRIVDDINASGYGLTFGLHTRIDDRVEQITSRLNIGNMYINRNQIGAIVGSQPFGGEGLSGTGPKAGGPNYVKRFTSDSFQLRNQVIATEAVSFERVQQELHAVRKPQRQKLKIIDLPGPTGESNQLALYPRGTILCMGPTLKDAEEQERLAREQGCSVLVICPGATGETAIDGFLNRAHLASLNGLDAVAVWSDEGDLRLVRRALADRNGPIIPLLCEQDLSERCVLERHTCIDTTAAGGNASLLAAMK